MAEMRKPKQEEHLTPVLTDAEIRALLAASKGDDFAARRDSAIIRLFLGTGARLSEIAGLRWTQDDPSTHGVELDQGIVRIMGKGRRERVVHMGAKAVEEGGRGGAALLRKPHPWAGSAVCARSRPVSAGRARGISQPGRASNPHVTRTQWQGIRAVSGVTAQH